MVANILVVLAGLMGAGGVMLAAAAAHAAPGTGLGAGHMLLFHAAALLGGSAVLHAGLLWRPLGLLALFGLVLGSLLFSADLTLRAFAGHRLFPMAAPTGGTMLIAAWILLALAALIGALHAG